MLLVIEGPNGVGKTTLINYLCQFAEYELIPTPRKLGAKEFDSAEFDKWLCTLPPTRKAYILDRHSMSHWAYCTLRGELSDFDDIIIKEGWSQLVKHGPLYAQFESQYAGPWPYNNGRIQLEQSQYVQLCNLYEEVWHMVPWSKVRLPWQGELEKTKELLDYARLNTFSLRERNGSYVQLAG